MLLLRQILVPSLFLGVSALSLAGCGQTGALYLPVTPPGTQRATLPESILPQGLMKPKKAPEAATEPGPDPSTPKP
jgi:predicted small lipoprotein YifL